MPDEAFVGIWQIWRKRKNAPYWVNHGASVSEKPSSEKGLKAFKTRISAVSGRKIGISAKIVVEGSSSVALKWAEM